MIRMTHHGMLSSMARRVEDNASVLRRAEERAITGQRYNRPSDAPSLVGEIHRMSADSADQEVWKANASSAGGMHSSMESALSSAHDILVRLREVAVNMASETRVGVDRSTAAIEVDALRESMLQVANMKMNGRYVFAGTAYDTQPFDATGAYAGTADEPTTQISPSQYVRVGLDGSQVFQGGVDVFATIATLSADLTADNTAGIQAALNSLDTATQQVSQWRGEVAADTLAGEDATVVAEGLEQMFNERLSELVSVDPAQAYTALGEAQNAYNATLQVIASSRTNSLFDMIS